MKCWFALQRELGVACSYRASNLLLAAALLTSCAVFNSAEADAARPTGGQVVAGTASIASSQTALQVNQATSKAVINWQDFSIGQGNSVQINNGTGAALHRVTGNNVSTIAGSLKATGSAYLVNQSGVAPGGKVVTGGDFVASTRDIPTAGFMAGGTVVAQGNSSGAALIGQSVTNITGVTLSTNDTVSTSPEGADGHKRDGGRASRPNFKVAKK